MSRSFERRLIYAASIWQLLTGGITTFIYALVIKNQGASTGHLSAIEAKGMQSIFDSLYSFTVTYGLFFIVIAIINMMLVIKFVKDHTIQYKLPFYWIGLAVVFYFLTDYISVALCLIAGVVALSKNKSIQFMNSTAKQ